MPEGFSIIVIKITNILQFARNTSCRRSEHYQNLLKGYPGSKLICAMRVMLKFMPDRSAKSTSVASTAKIYCHSLNASQLKREIQRHLSGNQPSQTGMAFFEAHPGTASIMSASSQPARIISQLPYN